MVTGNGIRFGKQSRHGEKEHILFLPGQTDACKKRRGKPGCFRKQESEYV